MVPRPARLQRGRRTRHPVGRAARLAHMRGVPSRDEEVGLNRVRQAVPSLWPPEPVLGRLAQLRREQDSVRQSVHRNPGRLDCPRERSRDDEVKPLADRLQVGAHSGRLPPAPLGQAGVEHPAPELEQLRGACRVGAVLLKLFAERYMGIVSRFPMAKEGHEAGHDRAEGAG
eukprot:scaffold2073_cov101-Isochrysis_galbana.AAC.4